MTLRDKLLTGIRALRTGAQRHTTTPPISYSVEPDNEYHAVLVHTAERKPFRELLISLPALVEDTANHGDLLAMLTVAISEQQSQIEALERALGDVISARVAVVAAQDGQGVLREALAKGYTTRGAILEVKAEADLKRTTSTDRTSDDNTQNADAAARRVRAGLTGLMDKLAGLNLSAQSEKDTVSQSVSRLRSVSTSSDSSKRRLVYKLAIKELIAPHDRLDEPAGTGKSKTRAGAKA
jgi:hypothetical protein